MAVTFGNNILSQKAQRMLSISSDSLSTVFERLSSGQRINRASDDAAGLAIADGLNADRRVFAQGVRNFNDGISLLNVADGAISELSNITTRLIELSEQAANGVLGSSQRKSLNEEAQALKDEYFRITQSTKFNGLSLFDGSLGTLRLQGGIGVDGGIAQGLGGAIGTGELENEVTFNTPGTNGYAVTSGDINGDGNIDLIVGGYDLGKSAGFLSIQFGDGNGSFAESVSFALTRHTLTNISLVDLDGNGSLDIVSSDTSKTISVLLNDGTGSFGAIASFSTTDTAEGMSLKDLNGDGIVDLVTAGQTGAVGQSTVFLGQGDGSFAELATFSTESGTSSDVELGDVNGDGILDLVTVGNSSFGYPNGSLRLGDGTGQFGSKTSLSIGDAGGSGANGVTLSDLDDDGSLDIIVTGRLNSISGQAGVLLNDGTGTFGSLTNYAMTTSNSFDVRTEDLNGDGLLDLVTLGTRVGGSSLAVRFGNGDGTFGSATTYDPALNSTSQLTSADFNNDGVVDLVAIGTKTPKGAFTLFQSSTTDGIGPLMNFSLETMADARQALPIFQRKLEQLAQQRGTIGAFQSRLATATNVLQASAENFATAESRVRDADIALESSKLVRLNILQQATSAVLAQANQQPALALQLLT